MSELSVKLEALKNGRPTNEIVQEMGISRMTFHRIERGKTVKLSTLLEIADYLKADESDRVELLAAWLKLEAGPYAKKLLIEPITVGASYLNFSAESQQAKAMMLFNDLTAADRRQIIQAMERPEVMRALASLNRFYDNMRPEAVHCEKSPVKYAIGTE